MNAMNLIATLGLDTSGYESGLKGASGMAQSFASSFKKILGGVAVAGAAGATVAGAAVTKIVKSSVKAYAEYEQLVGGVDTLFGNGGKSFEQYAENASESMYKMGQRGEDVMKIQKAMIAMGYDLGEAGADGIYGPKTQAALDKYAKAGGAMVREAYNQTNAASKKVQENADKAYKTAGLSANEYMETAIGFSGALLGSLGGDTEKAANMTDMAILDMADQANKYGKTVEEVSATYTSLARGNYMTIDNLFGGRFKGTKQGLRDMLDYAEKYQKSLGKTVKYSENSYADIISAIHDVSVATGVYGTTANEAADTIQGSLNSTKAAWKNLLVSFATGKDINKRLDSLVDSAKNVVKNVMPVVTTSLKSIGSFVSEIAPIIAQELPGLITEVGPALLQAVGSLAGSIVTNLPAMLGALGGAVKKAILGDEGENASWPEVGSAVLKGIKETFKGGMDDIKTLLGIDGDVSWNEIGLAISNGAKTAVTEGTNFIKELLGLEPDASWTEIGTAISNGAKTAITEGTSFIKGLLGIEEGASWQEIGTAISNGAKTAITEGTNFIKGLLGIEEGESWIEIGTAISNGAKTAVTEGTNFIKGLLGINEGDSWDEIGTAISNGAKTAVTEGTNFIKGLLGVEEGASWDEIGGAIGRGARSIIKGAGNFTKDLLGITDGMSYDEIGKAIESGAKSVINGGANFIKELLGIDGEPWTEVGDSIIGGIKSAWTNYAETMNGIREFFGGGVDEGENRYKQGYDYFSDNTTYTNGTGGGRRKVQVDAEVQSVTVAETAEALEVSAKIIGLDATGVDPINIDANVDNVDTTKAQEALDSTKLPHYVAEADVTKAQGALDTTKLPGYVAEADVSKVQEALDSTKLPDYVANVRVVYHEEGGSGGGRVKRNASAMSSGHIFDRPTLFGFADGKYQIAGDVGAEAVVGVRSLKDMISEAVQDQFGAVISALGDIRAGQGMGDVKVVLDTGATVGGLVREMDKQMGGFTRWRGGGRA